MLFAGYVDNDQTNDDKPWVYHNNNVGPEGNSKRNKKVMPGHGCVII